MVTGVELLDHGLCRDEVRFLRASALHTMTQRVQSIKIRARHNDANETRTQEDLLIPCQGTFEHIFGGERRRELSQEERVCDQSQKAGDDYSPDCEDASPWTERCLQHGVERPQPTSSPRSTE